jgi:hypothetical protein
LGIGYVLKHWGREKGQVLEAATRVVQLLGIDERKLNPTDPIGLHLLELMKNFRSLHCHAEPPPTHHGSRIIRRQNKSLIDFRQVIRLCD